MEEQHEKCVAATKVKMSASEKISEQERLRHFLHNTCKALFTRRGANPGARDTLTRGLP